MRFFEFLRRGKTPASLEASHTGPPDSSFIGDLLVHSFVDSHFGFSDADLNALAAPLPETVRDLAGFWINLYLCWILRMEVQAKYGEAFFDAAFQAARGRLALGEHLDGGTAGLADALSYWFEQLDIASANLGQTVKGIPLPVEFFAALAFLVLTPESPFFKQTEIPPGLDLDVAGVLERAKTQALRLIELIAEVGGNLKLGFKPQPCTRAEGVTPCQRDHTTPDRVGRPEDDPVAEGARLAKVISGMISRGEPVTAELRDRAVSVQEEASEKIFRDFDLIISASEDALLDLAGVATYLRAHENWPPTGSIKGYPEADEELDFILSRIEEMGGKIPAREYFAIRALTDDTCVEAHYMQGRLKRGWPSLFPNEPSLDWSKRPGFQEKYLKYRHNNVLFPLEKRCVSRYDLYFARRLDEKERAELAKGVKDFVGSMANRTSPIDTHAAIGLLKELFGFLEKAAAIGGDLDKPIEYVHSAYRIVLKHFSKSLEFCPEAVEGLREAEAHRWSTSDLVLNPLSAFIQRIPDNADVIPALLSEPAEIFAKVLDPPMTDIARGEVTRMMGESTEVRNYFRFHPQKLAALGLGPEGSETGAP